MRKTGKDLLIKIEEIHIPKKDYPATGQYPPDSPRFDELKRHLKRHGLLTPVFIDPDKVLLQGHYRLWAWKALGKTHIKAHVVENGKEIKVYFDELLENLEKRGK